MSEHELDARGLFRRDGGSCGALIASIEWAKTSLGPIDAWPASLRTLVATILRSKQPMFIFWGPERIQFYNDAYVPSFGVGKHPAAMGQRAEDCWSEIWSLIQPQIDNAVLQGKSTWHEDAQVSILRNDRLEETYWNYGYSPAYDELGVARGALVTCHETTQRVLAERRRAVLRRLSDRLGACQSYDEIVTEAFGVLRSAAVDVPFALLYRKADDKLDLRSTLGVDLQKQTTLDEWLRAVIAQKDRATEFLRCTIEAPQRFVCEPWPEPPSEVIIVESQRQTPAVLALGVSARLPFDAPYAAFAADLLLEIEQAIERADEHQARLRAELERKAIIEQTPFAAALLSGPELRFAVVNPAYEKLVARRVPIGERLDDVIPELRGTTMLALVRDVYASGTPYVANEHEQELIRDGLGESEQRFLRLTMQPARGSNGEVTGVLVVAVDVSELSRVRRALESSAREREELVRALDAANRAKDEFLATVSHELRTPLNAITGWSKMLQRGDLPAERAKHAVDTIARNAKAQAKIIDDLLDVSRIIAGSLRLDVQSIEVAALIEETLASMQHAIEARGVRFSSTIAADAGVIRGDAHRLQQVLWNLLSNAVKFTPRGGAIAVDVRRVESLVDFSVSDTGQGIAPDLLPRLFERFRQGDGSSTREHGGLGLGLSIARHIVELHGGTITAHSDGPGRGATFSVRLPLSPLRPTPDPEPSDQHPSSPSLESQGDELAGLSVLVVDDEPDSREMLGEMLSQLGAKVFIAGSAREALAVLDREHPHVLVSDIGMPGTNGYDLIRAVRQRSASDNGEIAAIALTAYASAEDQRRALEAGFHKHLSKPIELSELVSSIAGIARSAPAR